MYLRSLLGGRVERISHSPPLSSLNTPAHKLIINGLLHEDAGASRAALPVIKKHTLMGLLDRLVHCKREKTLLNIWQHYG